MISRRELFKLLATAAFAPGALPLDGLGFHSLAEAATLEHVDPSQNPKFLPLFLERYRIFHEDKLSGPAWSKEFLKFWREEFSRPRDFVQRLHGDWLWPRFQWIYEFQTAASPSDKPKIDFTKWQWFELEEPDRFRSAFAKATGVNVGKNWCGIEGNLKKATFLRKAVDGFIGESFELKPLKKISEESWRFDGAAHTLVAHSMDSRGTGEPTGGKAIWRQTFPQHMLPPNRTAAAALLQKKISGEFLMVPHAQRLSLIDEREWLFFP